MSEVNISINGRIYEIGCDQGQEERIQDLAAYIDHRLQQIARSGAAYNDAHLMVLTSLVLADELFDVRELASGAAPAQQPAPQKKEQAAEAAPPALSEAEEKALIRLLDQMTKRVEGISQRVQAA
ncbi:MAG: cell division protein ZapA [Alphaproteobacteria bacterium]|nr:cell division protein ZapA [Alphaproteobacteria bacterium]